MGSLCEARWEVVVEGISIVPGVCFFSFAVNIKAHSAVSCCAILIHHKRCVAVFGGTAWWPVNLEPTTREQEICPYHSPQVLVLAEFTSSLMADCMNSA